MNLSLFWKKVRRNVKTECDEWIGALRNGYGCLKRGGKTYSAHRFVWESFFGEIPKGLFVCHRCDNRKCVNTDHLFLGTHSDNMKDAYKKGRLHTPYEKGKIYCKHGIGMYEEHGCRCDTCKKAKKYYNAKRKRKRD